MYGHVYAGWLDASHLNYDTSFPEDVPITDGTQVEAVSSCKYLGSFWMHTSNLTGTLQTMELSFCQSHHSFIFNQSFVIENRLCFSFISSLALQDKTAWTASLEHVPKSEE